MTAHDYALKEINELRGFTSDVHVTGITVATSHLPHPQFKTPKEPHTL